MRLAMAVFAIGLIGLSAGCGGGDEGDAWTCTATLYDSGGTFPPQPQPNQTVHTPLDELDAEGQCISGLEDAASRANAAHGNLSHFNPQCSCYAEVPGPVAPR